MFFLKLFLLGPPLVVAVVLHEIAHGYVAWRLGDPTAKSLGRLTLNPLRHIDPILTILLPGLLILAGSAVIFGGAKPVPVDPRYFRNPRYGMVLVALAGPLTNFILAALSLWTYHLLNAVELQGVFPLLALNVLRTWAQASAVINLVLGTFNLFPIPPLDGGRIAVGLLPAGLALPLARLERYGLLIIFALLYFQVIDAYLSVVLRFFLGDQPFGA